MDIHTIKVGVDNCHIIKDGSIILIDGGMPGECEKFFKGLKRLNIDPADISIIVVTHAHWDHIGCLKKIKDVTGAKVVAQKNAKSVIEKGELLMPPAVTRWGKIFGSFLKNWSKKFTIEPTPVDIEIGEDEFPLEEYGIHGKVLFTPGHSFGSISIVLDSGEAFVGDMAMNGIPLTLVPNLPIFAEDMNLLKNSWKKLLEQGVNRIYPAHGKSFPVEKILPKIKSAFPELIGE